LQKRIKIIKRDRAYIFFSKDKQKIFGFKTDAAVTHLYILKLYVSPGSHSSFERRSGPRRVHRDDVDSLIKLFIVQTFVRNLM